ncbi:MAG: hypothetical protein IJS78_06435 [Clostridia bacterium]|nr:hypothetical protein [Clostridia bacterium]
MNEETVKTEEVKSDPAVAAAGDNIPDATGNTADTGENAAPAGTAPETADPEKFESLIEGPYRDLYRSRVSAIVKERLKSAKETVGKYEKLAPVIETLAVKYGVESGDTDGLVRAIADEGKATAEKAAEDEKLGVGEIVARWSEEAEAAKAHFPSLDLSAELSDPVFASLLLSGADVERAYVATHADEIIPAAMRYAVKEAGRKISARVAENGTRPAESGATRAGSTLPVSDVRALTRRQRQEIIRRVGMGETIRF